MIFPYRLYEVLPTPENDAGLLYRPVIPVQVVGDLSGHQSILGLVDTGSDVTVLPSFLLPLIGLKKTHERARFRGAGGQLVTASYASVELAQFSGTIKKRGT